MEGVTTVLYEDEMPTACEAYEMARRAQLNPVREVVLQAIKKGLYETTYERGLTDANIDDLRKRPFLYKIEPVETKVGFEYIISWDQSNKQK